ASDATTLTAGGDFAPGQMVGKYRIIKKIGAGGMGEVYQAEQTNLKRVVAIKTLAAAYAADAAFLARFVREARLAAALQHPHVIQIIDVDQDPASGKHYLVMEYAGGGTLRQRLERKGRLAENEALDIAIAIAEALVAAAERRIVHRDIKPDNIMFTESGMPKLADLGLAKEIDQEHSASLTSSRLTLGTPAYMPPEQIDDSKNVDARADIYSLGATLYHALVGEPPYPSATAVAAMRSALSAPVPDPRQKRPEISLATAAAIQRCLAKDPNARFASAAELLSALQAARRAQNGNRSADLTSALTAADLALKQSLAPTWRRAVAYLVDALILSPLLILVQRGVWPGVLVFCAWLYFGLLESSAKQATLGKRVLHIFVADSHGRRLSFLRASGRYFGHILCWSLAGGAGFLPAIFTERRQGLHDWLSDCVVLQGDRPNA
ncbi:MAG: protein kinase, partial [Planctomycetota bacterium]|nr:protein kinase [Planctomycetota bacterium]